MRLYIHSFLALLFFLYSLPIFSACQFKSQNLNYFPLIQSFIVNPTAPASPYFTSFKDIYLKFGKQTILQPNENINEWYDRFCEVAPLSDIEWLIYQSDLSDIQELKNAVIQNTGLITYLRTNKFARHLVKNKCLETIEYLLFAKKCEPFVTADKDVWQTKKPDIQKMEVLIQEGTKEFLTIESHYIRLRMAYQIIRLAHYSGQYSKVKYLYNYFIPKINHAPSTIQYWIEGHYAGALKALGERAKAAYFYARVFHHCPAKRESAFLSFEVRTDYDWLNALSLCENDQERTALYALRASFRNSRAVDEMIDIYSLHPKSNYLESILIQEIEKQEKKPVVEYIKKLDTFVKQVIDEKKVAHLEIWLLALGYLKYLNNDYFEAKLAFNAVSDYTQSKALLEQIAIFNMAIEIKEWEKINEEVAQRIWEFQSENEVFNRYPTLQSLLSKQVFQNLKNHGNPGLAVLYKFGLNAVKVNPSEEVIRDIKELAKKENINPFEKSLMVLSKNQFNTEIQALYATWLMTLNEWEAAEKAWQEIPLADIELFGKSNPFVERLNECVHCPVKSNERQLTKPQIVAEMLKLQYDIKANRTESPQYYYKMGLGLYNMSYFGYAWNMLDYFRSGSSLKAERLENSSDILKHPLYPNGNRENIDLSKALGYFEKAITLSTDKELSARATFMAARCEQKMSHVTKTANKIKYFALLNTKYKDTQYYDKVIESCKYFKYYVN
jgi:hypothetical protein